MRVALDKSPVVALFCLACLVVPGGRASAATAPVQDQRGQQEPPRAEERIEVTATRIPEAVETLPGSVTVIHADELRARGVTDLAGALQLVGGVTVAPGGDAGPGGSTPEVMGLREIDAFLLVVDGVPWGGAFNPDTASLDLTGVERIEIVRGPAPVTYGATAFSGVIHVIHAQAGSAGRYATASFGSHQSSRLAGWTDLGGSGSFHHSIFASYEHRGFDDERTDWARGNVLYRADADFAGGTFRLDAAGTLLRQDPASPHPREGRALSDRVPIDANHNPRDAHIDEDRLQVNARYDRSFGSTTWNTTLSVARSTNELVRGFLVEELDEEPFNAKGFDQDREVTDLYLDTHVAFDVTGQLKLVVGADLLHGSADAETTTFEYAVSLDGRNAPRSSAAEDLEELDLEETRNFGGLYAQAIVQPTDRLQVLAGLRLNRTSEERDGRAEPIGEEEEDMGTEESVSEDRDDTRLTGEIGFNYRAWESADAGIWVYGTYRDAYKPAAIDFGPEVEGGILEPETAHVFQAGAKGRWLDGKIEAEANVFRMDFSNLVLPAVVDGFPTLVNAGEQRFTGFEVEGAWWIQPDLRWQFAGAIHESKFRDYTRPFDGVLTRLRGNRLELTPENLMSTGLLYQPLDGINGSAIVEYVGSRYLDKRNRALADSYTTLDASLGYRFDRWELRVDGRNLTDERPPIAESELGDAQYYLLPGRTVLVGVRWTR